MRWSSENQNRKGIWRGGCSYRCETFRYIRFRPGNSWCERAREGRSLCSVCRFCLPNWREKKRGMVNCCFAEWELVAVAGKSTVAELCGGLPDGIIYLGL